jgi:hypothetical protein
MRGRRPDGWSRIGNFLLSCTHVRTKADWRPDHDIWIAILALRRRASRQDTTSTGRLIDLPFIGTWKESETVRVLIGVQTGCWDVRTDASWIEASRYSVGSEWKRYVVRTDDAGLSGVRSGWTRRPDGWNSGQMGVRTRWHFVRTADRELKIFWLWSTSE